MLKECALDNAAHAALALRVDNAARNRTAIGILTADYPDMKLGDAYAVQNLLRQRMESRGVRVTGLKMGLTSRAKMQQMGVTESLHGFITDDGAYADGAEIPVARFIHPRIEAEIAVVMKTALKGPHCDAKRAGAAIDFVLPAVEVIDSRFADFKFDIASVVADNTSAAGYVVGGRTRQLHEIDLLTEGVVLTRNGQVAEVGAGAAVLGDPLAAVAMLANQRAELGTEIPAGCLVMTGGITAAIHVAAGDVVVVHYQSLGSVRMRFV
ncbi:MAG: fumarylacetoacetate hydrolase family protein [Gammaproteobacteria bacterium]